MWYSINATTRVVDPPCLSGEEETLQGRVHVEQDADPRHRSQDQTHHLHQKVYLFKMK